MASMPAFTQSGGAATDITRDALRESQRLFLLVKLSAQTIGPISKC
jgi:hypothetical protein